MGLWGLRRCAFGPRTQPKAALVVGGCTRIGTCLRDCCRLVPSLTVGVLIRLVALRIQYPDREGLSLVKSSAPVNATIVAHLMRRRKTVLNQNPDREGGDRGTSAA